MLEPRKLNIKQDHVEDDWSNETRGYSCFTQAIFFEDRLQLLKAMLLDPSSNTSIYPSRGFEIQCCQSVELYSCL